MCDRKRVRRLPPVRDSIVARLSGRLTVDFCQLPMPLVGHSSLWATAIFSRLTTLVSAVLQDLLPVAVSQISRKLVTTIGVSAKFWSSGTAGGMTLAGLNRSPLASH